MELKWRKRVDQTWSLWWDEKRLLCADVVKTNGMNNDLAWRVYISSQLNPTDTSYSYAWFEDLGAAQKHAEDRATVLIIGGHYGV